MRRSAQLAEQLTPAVVQKQPAGLLDYFGIKNGGKNPQSLAEVIAPVLDLDRWYKVADEEYLTGGISGHASAGWVTASPISLAIPPLEVWHVHQFGWLLSMTEGRTCIFSPGSRVPEGGFLTGGFPIVDHPIAITSPAAVATYAYYGGTVWKGYGKFFRAGTVFGTHVTQITAASDFSWQLRFTRMRRI